MPRLGLPRPSSLADAFTKLSLALALALVIVTLYKHHVYDVTDPYKCDALLNHGQWLDSPDRDPEHKPFLSWQPPGCILHEYIDEEIARCSRGGKILFVGDTGTRQVFWAAARKLDKNWVFERKARRDTHEDISYCKNGACLKFIWDPWLNSTALHDELKAYRNRGSQETAFAPRPGSGLDTGNARSTAMLLGGGLWHARHIQVGALKHFQASINDIMASAFSENGMAGLKTVALSDTEGLQDQIFFAPVLEPQYENLSPSRATTIVPEKITAMNDYLEQLSLHLGLKVLWSYANMTRGYPRAYGESGLHVVENVADRMADVLLNARCNAKAARQEGFPFDRTCCTNYQPLKWTQAILLVVTIVVLPIVAIMAMKCTSTAPPRVGFEKRVVRQRSSSVSLNSTVSIAAAFLILLLTVFFCFLADRTQIFDKARKQYTVMDFRYLIALAVGCCLLTIRGPNTTPGRRRSDSFPGSIVRQTFLPRSQAEEFKGWMQLYVLVYGYTGASSELDFYEVLRVFLALYLFLSGYGHTMYFLQKKDYSMQRVATVLLRLNTLPILLSFVMARPYTSYYFAPLVSFWFLILYATLRISYMRNDSPPFLIAKILASGAVTTTLIHLEGVLEFISFALSIICRANIDVEGWRTRLATDNYVVYVGMLVAIIYTRMTAVMNAPPSRQSDLGRLLLDSFRVLHLLLVLLAIITVPLFWILTRRSHDTEDYNWWMPYIAWLPVLAFVILRNSTSFLRNYHCAAFSWLGRISLELYLLSQHIWMAGDGHGLLQTGLFKGDGTIKNDRWRDLVILTPVFFCLAWKAFTATTAFTKWVMRSEEERSECQNGSSSTNHARAGSELNFPNYDHALPSPNTQVDMRTEIEKRTRQSGMPKDVRRRLILIGVAVWLGSVVS